MPETSPYISVVVTARNDDHGGSLLSRMQAFVNGWIGQCKRHGLSSELIVVDWNPPEDRPPLMHALRWPADTSPCDVRFIKVPPEAHQRYKHAEAMPLYQMIAKNVGIRRARGSFVLATNIDIIFSDELVRYLAEERLDPSRMYRIDRHDVMSDVPVDGTVDEQLAYCKTHLIRLNAREGTFDLTPDGLRALSPDDIAASDSGISFGAGWHSVERYSPEQVFRWMGNDAEVMIRVPKVGASCLIFDLEPGPGAGTDPLRLQAIGDGGRVIAEKEVRARTALEVELSLGDGVVRSFRLHVLGGGRPLARDPRALNLRVFRCEWVPSAQVNLGRAGRSSRIRSSGKGGYWAGAKSVWIQFMHLLTRLGDEEPPVTFTVSASPGIRRWARFYIGVGGFTGLFFGGIRAYRSRPQLKRPGAVSDSSPISGSSPIFLHTNACGDFTLMARSHWIDLRGYPEFDMYSFNIDSVLCYAAHHAGVREEVLKDPLRIYHIEHGTGSGWTPEGQARLFDRLRANGIPWLEYQDLVNWAEQMRRFDSPMIFNRENWGLAELEPTEIVPHAESCAKGKRHEIEVPESLVPVAFRNPRQAHEALSALARDRFGPDAKIGQNVSLSFSSEAIAIPHKSMWYGPKDHVVLKSIEDLLDRLQSYSPEALRKHLGYLDREYMGKYLRQNSIRVARLIDKLEAMGLRPGSRLFEIGALFGSFALPLARLGYRVTVIDRYKAFDGALAAYVDLMQSEGIEVVSVTRETETEAIGRLTAFDCTIAMAVIEHIPHTPRHFLEMMRDKTLPGGIIALDTPNVTRFWNRRKLSQDESTFQDLSLQYECEIPYEGHHREYTSQEMHWLLDRIGCEEVSIDLFDYNMLQFEQIDGPHLECLSLILSDLAYADTILACGRRPKASAASS